MSLFDRLQEQLRKVGPQLEQVGKEIAADNFYRVARRLESEGGPRDQIVDHYESAAAGGSFSRVYALRRLAFYDRADGRIENARARLSDVVDLLHGDHRDRYGRWIAEELDESPTDYFAETMEELAEICLQMGEYAAAAQWARQVIDLDRERLHAYHCLITALVALGRREEARDALSRAALLDRAGIVDTWPGDFGLQ